MRHLCCLFLFLSLWVQSEAQGFGKNLMKVPDDDRSQIVCTVALLGKYFHSGETLSGSVLHVSITSAANHLQQSLLQALNSNTDYPWTIVVMDANGYDEMVIRSEHTLHEKPQCYFFVIENMEDEDMDNIYLSWKSYLNWNPLAQFVVYFSAVEETEEAMTDIMIEMLLSFMSKKIYNVNVIGQSEQSSLYFGKTAFPYHPDNNCGNRVISIETLDLCSYQEDDDDGKDVNGDDDNDEDNTDIESGENDYDNKDDNVSDAIETTNTKLTLYDTTPTTQSYITATEEASAEVAFIDDDNGSHEISKVYTNMRYTNNTKHGENQNFYVEELYRGLFLDKFPKDLSGCPLIAAYRPWEPYIFSEASDDHSFYIGTSKTDGSNDVSYSYNLNWEEMIGNDTSNNEDYIAYDDPLDLDEKIPSTSSEIRLNGIEYKMIQTIAERLHINIEMQVENSNLYHLFQQLIDGDIEMVVGGIDEDPSISPFVSSTIPYHQDDLTWCVAKAQHTHNLFNFLATFQIGAWLLTLIFLFSASLSILISQKYLKFRLGLFRSYFSINICVMGSVLGQSVNLRPMPASLRLSFGTTFFMGLLFSNIYQSFLVSTLTTSKSFYQISHLNEIYENQMLIMGSVDNVRHLNREGEIYCYVRQQFQMCYNIEECLQRAAKDIRVAVAVSRQHSFYNPRIPRDSLYCFDRNENIYIYLVTMLMPKKFHLLHKINPVIQHIIESGHMQKWARDLDRRRRINEEIQRAREQPFKSLTIAQVCGSFAFAGLLLLFSMLMFAIEQLVYWLVVKRKTRLKLAKYLHRKFI